MKYILHTCVCINTSIYLYIIVLEARSHKLMTCIVTMGKQRNDARIYSWPCVHWCSLASSCLCATQGLVRSSLLLFDHYISIFSLLGNDNKDPDAHIRENVTLLRVRHYKHIYYQWENTRVVAVRQCIQIYIYIYIHTYTLDVISLEAPLVLIFGWFWVGLYFYVQLQRNIKKNINIYICIYIEINTCTYLYICVCNVKMRSISGIRL